MARLILARLKALPATVGLRPLARALGACAFLVGTWLSPGIANASCKIQLPDAILRALDAAGDTDPRGAIEEAQRRLKALDEREPLQAAQLNAIISDAYDTLNDDVSAIDAITQGMSQLGRVPQTPEALQLGRRLALTRADTAETSEELTVALASLNGFESLVPDGTLERACLLLVRSRVEYRLKRHDLAAMDGILAYRSASAIGPSDAAAEAAYVLANVYRRAGLFGYAIRMVDEAIEATRSRGQMAALAGSLFVKAQVQVAMGEYEQAMSTAAESGEIDARLHDDLGLAFANSVRCDAQGRAGRLDEAERSCAAAEAGFRKGNRLDQVAVVRVRLGRIALQRGHASEALRLFSGLLDGEGRRLPPIYHADYYRYRGDAEALAGHPVEALRDHREAMKISDADMAQEHTLAAAVLEGQVQAEHASAEKKSLQARLVAEQQRASSEAKLSRLGLSLAGVALALVALLGFLLRSRSVHQQALRAAYEKVETHARVIHIIREGVILVDQSGRIEYANPSVVRLLGRRAEDLIGTSLSAFGISPSELDARASDDVTGGQVGGREVEVLDGGGYPLILLLSASQLTLGNRSLRVVVVQDVTELRRLEREVLEISGSERGRLGSEIHEELGQELAGVALLLRSLNVAEDGDAESLDFIIQQINAAIEKARVVAHGLSPVQLSGGSLESALPRLAKEMAGRCAVEVGCAGDLDGALLPQIHADQLYRAAEDGMTALARAGGARRLELRLSVTDRLVTLTIDDDSRVVGVDAFAGSAAQRLIAFRARLVGGAARYDRTAAGGRRIVVTVPLPGASTPTPGSDILQPAAVRH